MKTGRYRHYKGNEYVVLGVARHSEFERLYRDARMGPIPPANSQLTHELVGKIVIGLDLDAQPRWGG